MKFSQQFLLSLLLLLGLSTTLQAQQSSSHGRSVILITIDGLRPDMISDPLQPTPFLKQMVREGQFVPHIQGIPPSMTYPSHTTIITGVPPREHGIHCNRQFQYNRDEPLLYNLWADSIKAPTLWQQIHEAGLKTASILWPVSTGSRYIDYNVPEYFPTPDEHWQGGAMDYIRPVCTPAGLLEELEREATGRLTDATMRSASFEYDAKVAYMTNYLVNTYHPSFISVHLITTDYAQHATGTQSDWTLQAVASADNAVGLIVENLRYQHLLDSTTIIVTGDHGFVNAKWRLRPNALLVEAGLLSAQTGGEWQACFHSLGAASYLYLNPSLKAKERQRCLKQITQLLEQQPYTVRCQYHLLTQPEITSLGGDPEAALCIDPIAGTACANDRTGDFLSPRTGGYHGYVNGCDPTCLVLYGAANKDIQLPQESMKQTAIAPMIRQWILHLP